MPGGKVHTKKFDKCLKEVKAKGGKSAKFAAPICMKSIGYEGSINKGHRRKK